MKNYSCTIALAGIALSALLCSCTTQTSKSNSNPPAPAATPAAAAPAPASAVATTPPPPVVSMANFTGVWKAEFDGAIGHLNYTFDLKQDGPKLTGKATRIADAGTNVTDIADGKVTGNTVSFVENLSLNGQDLAINYSGTLAGDQLKLTRAVGEFATNEITATRAK